MQDKNKNSKKPKNIASFVEQLVKTTVEDCGCTLWDVEFTSVGTVRTLTIYIDKPEGISLTDCETVNYAVDPLLDEADPIEESYSLEISSPGIERELKKEEHFKAYIGSECSVRLYAPKDGRKQFDAILKDYDAESDKVTFEIDGESVEFERRECALIKNKAEFF